MIEEVVFTERMEMIWNTFMTGKIAWIVLFVTKRWSCQVSNIIFIQSSRRYFEEQFMLF